MESQKKIRIAVFASGQGSNAEKINEYFRAHPKIEVALIVCNKPGAGVLKVASDFHQPTMIIEKNKFKETGYLNELRENKIDFIVLAGFLWKIPSCLVESFPGRIINIHPALLPAYGGKGMYGMKVHQAVIENGEKQSGITIHFVDEKYDNGKIIFQARTDISKEDNPESLAKKIHVLEHLWYPKITEKAVLESLK